jgi:hypothetical protein
VADGGIERVGMGLSCGWRLNMISGGMHNLANWQKKDLVAVISISKRNRKYEELGNV